MPVSVSVLSLVNAGAEQLVPDDIRALVRACQDAPEDDAPKLVLADRLQEGGDDGLAFALRWMVGAGRWPERIREGKKDVFWRWFWMDLDQWPRLRAGSDDRHHLPWFLTTAVETFTSWWRAVAFVADRWAYLDAERARGVPR